MNTGKFAGRVAVVTGASRGIGRAIAVKLARDGARVALMARTRDGEYGLDAAAEAVKLVGGDPYPLPTDVRDEDAVRRSIEEIVQRLGHVDFLINSASYAKLTPTTKTSMSDFDRMYSTICRSSFLVSQNCVPYMRDTRFVRNAHILNIAPPLLLDARHFHSRFAFTLAKYGASMCVLGMAEELKPYRIAVNALWAKFAIWSATAQNDSVFGDARNKCRNDSIMADAAYAILSRDSRSYTGNFAIDEEILAEEGYTDFSQYAIEPNAQLVKSLFVD